MIVVEGFSHFFRPASLAIRLYGNMFADHLLLGIFTDLTKVVVPVVFYVLGTFVSFVQALVFTLLTMVYVGSRSATTTSLRFTQLRSPRGEEDRGVWRSGPRESLNREETHVESRIGNHCSYWARTARDAELRAKRRRRGSTSAV